ncbi:hypothetical protein [Maridesulfovibrio sp.]|uniref:hypothetical protein n=1 Tax=Maridesulfovibrio sp. TaxID=2795000 RepID=UPI002A18CCCF|nr:hypothetical protein [Maridesulfovibrio sp.]
MSNHDDNLTELYDKDGNLIGALITAQLWSSIKPRIMDLLPKEAPKEKPEPIGEWETLKQYWDFAYPVDMDVHCELCGNKTENWETDEPRKFRLMSCNLGGLVTFKCMHCQGRVTKKHFKDEITVECTEYVPEKSKHLEARY